MERDTVLYSCHHQVLIKGGKIRKSHGEEITKMIFFHNWKFGQRLTLNNLHFSVRVVNSICYFIYYMVQHPGGTV